LLISSVGELVDLWFVFLPAAGGTLGDTQAQVLDKMERVVKANSFIIAASDAYVIFPVVVEPTRN